MVQNIWYARKLIYPVFNFTDGRDIGMRGDSVTFPPDNVVLLHGQKLILTKIIPTSPYFTQAILVSFSWAIGKSF